MKKAKKIWKLSKKSLVILMNKEEPRIRFEGFDQNWENTKIGNISKIVRGASPRPISDSKWFDDSSDVGWIRISDVTSQNGKIHHLEQKLSKLGQEKTRVLKDKHLLLSIAASVGKPVINYIKTGVHDGFIVFKENKFNIEFMYNWLEHFQPKWSKYGQPGTQVNLNSDIVRNQKIYIPKTDEQEKIGAFFEKLDRLIESQESYLELNKKLKKSLLQKLFPKEGEDRPELRFPGFNNKWEIKKLGNLCKVVTGKLDANAMEENGVYDFYTSGIQKFKINKYAFEGPSITIAGNGATVGYMHLADGKFNAYQRTYVLSNFISDRYFTYYSITKNLPKKIHEESRAGNIPYIVMDMLTELKLMSPTLKEQEKIGSLFKSLDEKIESEEKKLRAYKDFKKSMLQKMFV